MVRRSALGGFGTGHLIASTLASRPASDEVHDLHLIPAADEGRLEGPALENREIELDGDALRVDLEPGEQIGDRQLTG